MVGGEGVDLAVMFLEACVCLVTNSVCSEFLMFSNVGLKNKDYLRKNKRCIIRGCDSFAFNSSVSKYRPAENRCLLKVFIFNCQTSYVNGQNEVNGEKNGEWKNDLEGLQETSSEPNWALVRVVMWATTGKYFKGRTDRI